MRAPRTVRLVAAAGLVAALCVAGLASVAITTSSRLPGGPVTTGPLLPNVPPGFVARVGARLYLDGRPYAFTGVNAFNLATDWSVNAGCGEMVDDAALDGFFSSLRPHSMVKIQATQAMAFDVQARAMNWGPLDRVVAAAKRHDQKLILGLTTQAGECEEGRWKDLAWYDGGYRRPAGDDGRGLTPLSYWDWMRLVVPRYADSPAVGMWQLVVEPESSDCLPGFAGGACFSHTTCPTNAAGVLRRFFDDVGAELKHLDPHHLLASGVIGREQCGTAGDAYAAVHASPAIDVASFHDYGLDDAALPPLLERHLGDAAQLGKPLVVDEAGLTAGDGPGCRSRESRLLLFQAKLDAAFAAGVAGYVPWNVHFVDRAACDFDLNLDDPVLTLLRDHPLRR